MSTTDVLIVGAGAAGMMCAIEAGRRGRRVRIVDHARAPGEKIRISGGGRCNFTNLEAGPHAFLGENPRFATSALKRYSQHDFIKRVDRAGIAWHEKTLGQLFCDDSAKQIIAMLTGDMREGEAITLKMAPDQDVYALLKAAKEENGKQMVHTALGHIVPRRLAEAVAEQQGVKGKLAEVGDKVLRTLDQAVNGWTVKPVGSEGYRTAEVTLGGVATDQLDQQTMAVKSVPGLFVIGEAADITGWLGGYNFQWAWSSGWAAGQVC